MAKRYDVKDVVQAATGQWKAILVRLGGIDEGILDTNHHPCPKCGGNDRFRAFDDVNEKGGLICNQCFSTKNGDGLSALQWLTGLSFGDALAKIADYLGIKPIDAKDPAKDLEWREWNPSLAMFFCNRKKVSQEALLANGARMASYKREFTVIALPIIGEGLDTQHPVGWVIVNATGESLPKWDKTGRVTGHVKVKITVGSGVGFIGTHGISRLAVAGLVESAWKVEGLTDMLALFDAIPAVQRDREVVLTNSNGAAQSPKWMAGVFSQVNTRVVHDADDPGQAGAETWSQKISEQAGEGKSVTWIKLPYPIAKDHGKDLRDYLGEGNKFGDLCRLAETSGQEVKVAKTEEGDLDLKQARFPMQELLLKKLQLEVLYEDENGATRLFSSLNRKSVIIPFRHINRLQHEDLVQICGFPAVLYITNDQPDGNTTFSMAEVRRALSLFSSASRGRNDEKGVGIWQGKTRFGHLSETVVLANHSSAARYNGDKILKRVESARAEGLLLDMGGSHEDWFEFETIEPFLQQASDQSWRDDVISQMEDLLSRWNWRNQDVSPTLVTGLVLASWTQTIYNWRPMVSIAGESNSGKSLLLDFLFGEGDVHGIFGSLAYRSDESTLAGILQKIGNTARVLAIDEFEKSQERDKILKTLRSASRGGKQTQGSSGGKAVERQLRHIVWTAAIESGLHRQPDMNRFILLGLEPAAPGQHGKLRIPSPSTLETLGLKLMAIAVRGAIEAKALAEELKSVQVAVVDGRVVESYAVPAAALAVAGGCDAERAKQILVRLLDNVDRQEQGQTDQLALLDGILSTSVFTGSKHGAITIAQILSSSAHQVEYNHILEANGIKLRRDGGLFVSQKRVSRALLKATEWERQRIDEILLRLPAGPSGDRPERKKRRVGGVPTWGIDLPVCYTPDGGVDDDQEADGKRNQTMGDL